jgi:hypothetical protein
MRDQKSFRPSHHPIEHHLLLVLFRRKRTKPCEEHKPAELEKPREKVVCQLYSGSTKRQGRRCFFLLSLKIHLQSSIKNVGSQFHGDAEFALNLFQSHDALLALNRRLSEVYGELDRVAHAVALLVLEQDPRGADVTGDPRRSVVKAYRHLKSISLSATSFFIHAEAHPAIRPSKLTAIFRFLDRGDLRLASLAQDDPSIFRRNLDRVASGLGQSRSREVGDKTSHNAEYTSNNRGWNPLLIESYIFLIPSIYIEDEGKI